MCIYNKTIDTYTCINIYKRIYTCIYIYIHIIIYIFDVSNLIPLGMAWKTGSDKKRTLVKSNFNFSKTSISAIAWHRPFFTKYKPVYFYIYKYIYVYISAIAWHRPFFIKYKPVYFYIYKYIYVYIYAYIYIYIYIYM
jgi:hypothetical protein